MPMPTEKHPPQHPLRWVVDILLETASPMAIGSGRSGLENERLIARDANELPWIPGTSLAGVLRHQFLDAMQSDASSSEASGQEETSLPPETLVNQLFGFQGERPQNSNDPPDGQGSRLIVSPGMLVRADGKGVLEGLASVDETHPYYASLMALPERDHVRISHMGTADHRGKFREQLVPTGVRFMCQLEVRGTPADAPFIDRLLEIIRSPLFRLGAGTRNGFGELLVKQMKVQSFDLEQKQDLAAYLGKSSSLDAALKALDGEEEKEVQSAAPSSWEKVKLKLRPKDFFLFGAGTVQQTADLKALQDQADMRAEGRPVEEPISAKWLDAVAKKECYFQWTSAGAVWQERYLMPGTSIKGALSHRLAYHYNRLTGETIESVGDLAPEKSGVKFNMQAALRAYGLAIAPSNLNYRREEDWQALEAKVKGMSIADAREWTDFEEAIQDILDDKATEAPIIGKPVGEENKAVQQVFGLAKNEIGDGEAIGARGKVIIPDIKLDTDKVSEKLFNHVSIDRFTQGAMDGMLFEEVAISYAGELALDVWVDPSAFEDPAVKKAFSLALDDLTSGMLPLGGHTAKGHGMFTGSWDSTTLTPS